MTIIDKITEKLKTAPPEVRQYVLDVLEQLEARRALRSGLRPWARFRGVLSSSEALAGDPVAIQRRLRNEWR